MNSDEIMTIALLQELHQEPDKNYFFMRKILETPCMFGAVH
jgi:hypothetical protein